MRLTRLFVARELTPGSIIDLPEEAALHVARVLRARGGEAIVLFNGGGGEFDAFIKTVQGLRVTAAVGAARRVERESPLRVTLIQCIARGDRMDLIVQKTVELGVARILPVVSQRSVVRLDKAQAESKALHWRAVAVSACEQCGRNLVPEISVARPLLHCLGDLPPGGGARWVLEPESPPRGASAERDSVKQTSLNEALIAIGPEGGFAPDELEAFRVAGFSRLGLGPRVLRTETAAIAALTWLQARFGDM